MTVFQEARTIGDVVVVEEALGLSRDNVQIAAGSGALIIGTVLALNSATGFHVPLVDGGSNGTNTPRAILLENIELTGQPQWVIVLNRGQAVVRTSALVWPDGFDEVDAALETLRQTRGIMRNDISAPVPDGLRLVTLSLDPEPVVGDRFRSNLVGRTAGSALAISGAGLAGVYLDAKEGVLEGVATAGTIEIVESHPLATNSPVTSEIVIGAGVENTALPEILTSPLVLGAPVEFTGGVWTGASLVEVRLQETDDLDAPGDIYLDWTDDTSGVGDATEGQACYIAARANGDNAYRVINPTNYGPWAEVEDWPFAYTLNTDWINPGSSTQNGVNGAGATPYNPAKIAEQEKASGTGVLVTKAAGNANSTAVLAQVTGSTGPQLALDCFIQIGGNWESAVSLMSTVLGNAATMVSTIGHDRILWTEKHPDGASGAGIAEWCRNREITRRLSALYPGRVVDAALTFRQAPPLDGTDSAAQALDRIPTSYQADTAHPNLKGNQWLSRQVYQPFLDSLRSSLLPFIPVQRIESQNSTNQTSGGLVCDVPFYGSLTGVVVDFATAQTDFSIAIESGAIRIRRASATVLTAAYYDLPVRVLLGTNRRATTVRVHLGSDPASLTPKVFRVNQGFMAREDYDGDGNGAEIGDYTKFSMVVGVEMQSGDGADTTFIRIGGSNGMLLERRTTNRWDFTLRDQNTPGTNRASGTSSASAGQLVTVANGLMWLFVHCDIATGDYKMAINDQAGVAMTVTGTLANFNLTPWLGVNQSSRSADLLFTSTSGAGSRLCDANIHCLWLADGFLDFDTLANRDLFRDSTTKVAEALGANGAAGGVTPYLYMRGNGGDAAAGKNFGTGQDWHAHFPNSTAFASV